MTAVTTLNIIDLPKITPMSLHSIVQAAQESPITRLTGKIKTRTEGISLHDRKNFSLSISSYQFHFINFILSISYYQNSIENHLIHFNTPYQGNIANFHNFG